MEAGKTPKGAKTKNRIIDAAIKLIKEKGVGKTTLVEVCTIAEVAQGTFYHYFKSINDIIYEILRIEGEELKSVFNTINSDQPLVQLNKILEFQLDYYEKKGKAVVAQIFRNEFDPNSGESRIEQLLPTRMYLTKIISNGIVSGAFLPQQNEEQIGVEITSLITIYSFWWIRDCSGKTLKQIAGPHIMDYITRNLLKD